MEFEKPAYAIPSCKTITSHVEKKYNEATAALKKKVAITTDTWTTLTSEFYVTVTFSCNNGDWNMSWSLLHTHSMDERHTAENIATSLRAIVDK